MLCETAGSAAKGKRKQPVFGGLTRRVQCHNNDSGKQFGKIKGFDSEDDFRGLFDDLDVNSNKLGPTVARRNERLVKLMNAIGELELGKFEDNTIDAFGDAYEYLMTMYAGNAGKSGGEFFTPQEVSELLAKITVVGKTSVNKVYDPAAGFRVIITQANS